MNTNHLETLGTLRHDWSRSEVKEIFDLPFNDLLFIAQSIHRRNFDPNAVQVSTLLSIKTGGCPEDCAYCPQSVRYDTGLERQTLMELADVRAAAQRAKAHGATRFCMGAAWRSPKERDLQKVEAMVRAVKAEGSGLTFDIHNLSPPCSLLRNSLQIHHRLWLRCSGHCDKLLPSLCFGFCTFPYKSLLA